jgi:DnaJ-class molecular chaperone
MGLAEVFEIATKAIRRQRKATCHRCGGKGKISEETYEHSWDRTWEEITCPLCSGCGIYGGGQPSLTLYFQNEKQRDAVKAKLMEVTRNWVDEGDNVMEKQ